jgi:hypothetical protein
MTYLDVSPVIVSLRTNPSDFEMKRGWLRHFPSQHEFKFDGEGNVRLYASAQRGPCRYTRVLDCSGRVGIDPV